MRAKWVGGMLYLIHELSGRIIRWENSVKIIK